MDISRFRGTTVALVTPFDQNGNIDEIILKRLVDWHVDKGTDVILACGTTGESATLSHQEHHIVMKIIIEQAAGRIPVLCGTGSNSTLEAISLSQHAEELGADGILLVSPYYNKPTQEGLIQHFETIAKAVKIPVVVYNVPGRTGSNICADTTLSLAKVKNIIGIKEASGNLSQIMHILQKRPKNFLVLSGDDAITLPMLALGGDGVISVIANQVPDLMHKMVQSALEGDWDTARQLHFKLLPLMEANFLESNPIPVKAAMGMMGLLQENLRLPLVKMQSDTRKKLAKVLKKLELVD
ncbi:4-hydroxy-tetrahydrodipicolinate synthase [candidate division KSB1 bacterium]|nr:4-hydroxy-tetrahydrodipicolinate synthase [candidate division KSB1 bacterium]